MTPTAQGGVFTDVLANTSGDQLAVTVTRTRKTRALLVSVGFTGTITGFARRATSAFQVIINGNPVPATPTDDTDVLLARRVHVDLTSRAQRRSSRAPTFR